MFRPNQTCLIQVDGGTTDVYGIPTALKMVKELCTVVKMNIRSEKSAVRADTSATRGNAAEYQTDAEILFAKTTQANIDDIITVYGERLRVKAKWPRHNLQGSLDHYQIMCTFWSPE